MKKILITIALAIVTIVIGITAFTAIGANASDNLPIDPKVLSKINSQTYEKKIQDAATYMGMTTQEVEGFIAQAKKSCRADYELYYMRELTKDEKQICNDLEAMKLFDKK